MNLFKWLFGKKEKVALELPHEFLQADPPDWLLELKANELPHGEAFGVKVQLLAETRSGSATITVHPQIGEGAAQTATSDLTQIEGGRLMVLLGFSFPNDIGDVGAPVTEGVAANLTIHQREPYVIREGACNLASWLGSKKSQPPTVEIAMMLLGMKERILNQK